MHSKRNRGRIAATLLAVGGLAIAAPALACTIETDEFGRYIVDCDLSQYWAELDVRWRWEPPCCLPEINLTIDQFDYEVFGGTDFQVNVDVENHGNIDAKSFEVVALVAVVNGWTGEREDDQLLRATIPGLPAGAVQRHRLGVAHLPDRRWTYRVGVLGEVDPRVMGQGDAISESNEGDNQKIETCRIEGMSSAWGLAGMPPPPCD